jgi:hypothetical protein
MNVLVACEYSGIVRDAFLAEGHNAISADFLPTESPGPHFQGNVLELLEPGLFDLMIGHPPCTRLCNSGVRWLKERSLEAELWQAAKFFLQLLEAPVPKIAIENPLMHGYAMELIRVPYTQKIQPWEFGHREMKTTCLWLKELPELVPTKIVPGIHENIKMVSPSKDRGKIRSKTYLGIAKAMAQQWGNC